MFVTGLTRIMEKAGVPYEVVPGWEKRSLWRAGLSNKIKACMWHDTQSADASFATGRDAPTLGYVTSGLGYPLYNVLFGRSGKAYIVAAGSAAHAGRGSGGGMTRDDANRESVAFSFDANQSRYPVTAAQLESAARVGKAMTDDWGGNLVHIMHGEWNPHDRSDPTRIPGGWAGLKAAIKRGYWSAKPAAPKPAAPKPAAPAASTKPWPAGRGPWPDAFLTVSGNRNEYQDRALHKLLGDAGYDGATLAIRLQKRLRASGDYKGSITEQSQIGPQTIQAWQRFLKARGHYNGSITAQSQWGPQTTRATVNWLNQQAREYHK